MPSILWIVILIGLILDAGISITLNVCVVIATAKNVKNGVKVSPPDVIYLVMGLVNLILQCFLTVHSTLIVYFIPVLFMKDIYLPLTALILTLIYFSSWLNVWLSSYYCSSITNFTHQLSIWFRRKISTSLWLFLSLSAVCSFIIGVSSIWALNAEIEVSSLKNFTDGNSFIGGTFHFSSLYVHLAILLGCFLPFVLTLLWILLTFSSLIRHINRIKQNHSGFTRQAHISAIRRMCLLLTLCAIFYTSQTLFFSSSPSSSLNSQLIISWLLVLIFPTANAIIIIQASSKIQKTLVKTFCAGKHGN